MKITEISRLQKIIRALIGDVWHLGRENKELESKLEQAERANQDPYIAVLEAEIEELNPYKQACKALGEEVTRLRGAAEAPGLISDWERKYSDLAASVRKDVFEQGVDLANARMHIKTMRNIVMSYTFENTGYTADVIKELLLEIDNIPTKEAGHNKDVEHYQREVVRLQGKILALEIELQWRESLAPEKPNSYPIDTAPKTGDSIMVSNGAYTTCASWSNEGWITMCNHGHSIGFTPDRWCKMPDLSDKPVIEAETQDGKPEDGFNLERNTLSGKGYYYLSLDDSNMYDKLKSGGDPKDRLVCRMIIEKAKASYADHCKMTR